MIDLKPLKEQSSKFEDPIKSIVEMSRNTMSESDFIDFFISLRRKARERDNIKGEKQ